MITKQPNTAPIRRFLTNAFNDPDIEAFCQDHFPAVQDKFGRGMRKDEKIMWLLDHCRRIPDGFELLFKALEDWFQGDASRQSEINALRSQIKPGINSSISGQARSETTSAEMPRTTSPKPDQRISEAVPDATTAILNQSQGKKGGKVNGQEVK